jgi:hypothetical protein
MSHQNDIERKNAYVYSSLRNIYLGNSQAILRHIIYVDKNVSQIQTLILSSSVLYVKVEITFTFSQEYLET